MNSEISNTPPKSTQQPSSRLLKFIETGDPLTTNIAFGGDELDTAFITVRLRAAIALRLSPAVSKTQRLIVRVCGRR